MDDGQKRCRCKKSNCLKLYCDCFKDGYYCAAELCSCEKCFNSLYYQDSVEIAREEIELHDPHAFSSKICSQEQPTTTHNEGENQQIPIELKHRKGCNCKKSMCSKKYCECYQARVGCGSECRCERCENAFGKKGASREGECCSYYPQFQHSRYGEGASMTSTFTSSGKSDMVCLGQQAYHNAELMSQFTPSNNTMLELSEMWELANSSRINENIMSADSVHFSHAEGAPMTSTFTSSGKYDMVCLGQQAYHNAELMSQFTPSNNTMLELSEMWELANSSRINENILSVDSVHWPSSLLTTLPQFGGTKVSDSYGTPSGSYIHYPNTQAAMNSPVDKMDSNSKSDDQKQCRCKKSKCLKLYCACFKAGLYCVELCSCRECCNSLDYKDTVDEARKRIQSQDPLAFSSKNCPLTLSPTTHNVEKESQSIPIQLKERKGRCNCKKSLCRQKYCECYLARVGCGSECRCEGCENLFGKKGEYIMHNESSGTRAINESERYEPQFQHSDCRDDTSITQALTSDGNLDVVSLDRRFTPPDRSRTNENILSAASVHWPGSVVTPISLFGGSIVNDSNENSVDASDNNMPNPLSAYRPQRFS